MVSLEYCGEVTNYKDFQERAECYDGENRRHYYFMTLRADEVRTGNLNLFLSRDNNSTAVMSAGKFFGHFKAFQTQN